MSVDRLLSIYGQPVQSWPGEEALDEEARANLAALRPQQQPKLRPDETFRGTFLPFRETVDGKHEWAVPGFLQDVWDAATAVRDTSGTGLGPMPRPSQYSPEVFEQILGHGMAGALTGITGNLPRLMVKPPAGTTELGIFGGRNAKTANQEMLAKAEQMAADGVPREDIWKQTGWFQGVDGKWRFEIDDSQSVLGHGKTIGEALKHDPLASAYPETAGYEFEVGPLGRKMHGSFSPGHADVGIPPVITVSQDGPRGLSSTLHEVQHGVQGMEGFATGANQFGMSPEAMKIYRDIRKKMATPMTLEEWAASQFDGDIDAARASYKDYRKTAGKITPELDRIAQETAVEQAYRRSAGETEARLVQSRRDLTPEQRLANPPWQEGPYGYDVPESQQIVRFGNEGMSNASASAGNVMPIDRLPPEVMSDIAGWVMDNVPAVTKDVAGVPEYAAQHLAGLTGDGQPLAVRVFDMPIAEIKGFNRQPSEAAVAKYQGMLGQSEAPPILMDGDRFIDGGHRLEAYRRAGRATIPAVDIGPLIRMNWDGWVQGVADDPSFPTASRLSSSPQIMASMGDEGGRGVPPVFDWEVGQHSGSREVSVGGSTITYGINPQTRRAQIALVKTPKSKRGQGAARAAMETFLREADERGYTVSLTADPMEKGVSKPKLEAFYRSLGFVANKGKNKDFTTRDGMIREPGAKEKKADGGRAPLPLSGDAAKPTLRRLAQRNAKPTTSVDDALDH